MGLVEGWDREGLEPDEKVGQSKGGGAREEGMLRERWDRRRMGQGQGGATEKSGTKQKRMGQERKEGC